MEDDPGNRASPPDSAVIRLGFIGHRNGICEVTVTIEALRFLCRILTTTRFRRLGDDR